MNDSEDHDQISRCCYYLELEQIVEQLEKTFFFQLQFTVINEIQGGNGQLFAVPLSLAEP
jgi:hypothetical protein